jgi:DNA-binding transcriptional LysR family regulator
MNRIEDYQAFTAIMEKRSLTAAARHLGRSLQSVSRSLATLEREVGVELIRRTTRRLNPTDAGLLFYRRLSAALSEIEAAKLETSNRGTEPTGLLRISGSAGFAPLHIVPVLPEFLESYPGIEIELELSDGFVDLVSEGFDLAIRIGELPDSGLKARRLADSRRVVFAAPSYLATHGRPRSPEDLKRHQCIVRTTTRFGNNWPFKVRGRTKIINVNGRVRTTGADTANAAAALGLGIAVGPLWQVRSLVDRGDVELLLRRFEPPAIPIHAVWPATRVLAARTQVFIEFLAARLRKEQL